MLMYADMEDILMAKSAISGRPLRANLELTPVCNLNCEMCYIRHSIAETDRAGGVKGIAFWNGIISELKDLGVLIVTLIGGEPFLYPDIQQIYEYLTMEGFLLNITTNGTLLAKGVPEWLSSKPPRYVTVSLYGASDETYQRVTGNSHGFSQAIRGIENLQAAGIGVKLNFLVTQQNACDLEAIFQIKEKYNAPLLAFPYSLPAVRKSNPKQQRRLSAEECGVYQMEIRRLSDPENYREYCRKMVAGELNKEEMGCGDGVTCYAGTGQFWVDWQGNMIACGLMNQVSSRIEGRSLEACWEELRSEIHTIKTSQECRRCNKRGFCPVCAASMIGETGRFEGTPKYLCEMTDVMLAIAEREL